MKKIILALVVCFSLVLPFATQEKVAEATVFPNGYANQCCSPANGYPVCWIPATPAGAACYCNGVPGVGYAC
jgi:hypothetical protein